MKTLKLLLIGVFLFSNLKNIIADGDVGARSCPSGFVRLGNANCYSAIDRSVERNKEEARQYCESLGAILPVIDTLEELDAVVEYVNPEVESHVWLGLSATPDRKWTWDDGRQMDDDWWMPGEPNNSRGEEYDAEIAEYHDTPGINDVNNAQKKGTLCQFRDYFQALRACSAK